MQENKEKAARANPITYVSTNALPPFLIVHGDNDPVVPFHQRELLFDALKKAGTQVNLHRVIGAGHGQGIGGPEIEARVNGFFEQVLAREDANKDGRVTKEEFKGPPPLFQRLDANGDGALTKEDFR